MRRPLAELLNGLGSTFVDKGKPALGERLYTMATKADCRWSVPWYNLGLHAKNTGRWKESLSFNQRALELNPRDEATLWNLGIAATALRDWDEARKAWRAYGIELQEGVGEVLMPAVTACVRLDPAEQGEVVWGQRLDPARMVILSVPLPESGFRFHDIILNDGASSGTRVDQHGREVPVFDELSIWEVSEYSTFRANLQIPDETAEERPIDLCRTHQLGIEDWTTIRFICAKCSRGTSGPHECDAKPLADGSRRFGFGARKEEDLSRALEEWTSSNAGAEFGKLELVLSAKLT